MGKHSKKRQRTELQDEDTEIQPLGAVKSVFGDQEKDEEERRLEAILFGTSFLPTSSAQAGASLNDGYSKDTGVEDEGDLDNVMDSDIFFVDDAGSSTIHNGPPESVGGEYYPGKEFESPTEPEQSSSQTKSRSELGSLQFLRRKKSAWEDPDDANVKVSLVSDKRLRKLRDTTDEDEVGGVDYEAKLRRQYEKVHPAPEWASIARDQQRKKKRRRSSISDQDVVFDDENQLDAILSTSGGLLSSRRKQTLPSGQLSIERLRDANQSAKAEGAISSVNFHPSPSVPLLMITSADRRLRLFNIDGHTNPHLQSVHIPSLPVTTAQFHPSGSSILLTGQRPFYYSYDLQSGNCIRSPRGLWGTHASNPDTKDLSMEICGYSPTGDILAVAGRRGYVHLVDWRRGGGQVVGSLKMNSGIKDLWWSNDQHLMTLGGNAEVYLWDVGGRQCVRRWKEEGGFGSIVMSGSRNNSYLAIGSNTGLVNIFGSESVDPIFSNNPKPLKTIGNLTTSISMMCFNHDSQILALASKTKKDQLKMVHLPSLTVFANWPTATTPLGNVTSMCFSPGSEYAAIGNTQGRALLYNLKHFSSQ